MVTTRVVRQSSRAITKVLPILDTIGVDFNLRRRIDKEENQISRRHRKGTPEEEYPLSEDGIEALNALSPRSTPQLVIRAIMKESVQICIPCGATIICTDTSISTAPRPRATCGDALT